MKISGHEGASGPNRSGDVRGVSGDVKRGRGAQRGATEAGDKVSVSEDARRLSRLRADVGDAGAIRTEKVEEVRGRIERGEFNIDLKAVARKFLEVILGGRVE